MDSSHRPSVFRPRTVVCERHELIRFGLKRVVSEVVEIVGEASDGMAATEVIRRLHPDFVILDVDLDVLNGVEVTRRIAQDMPNTNVLILTDSYHATKYHNQLIRAGARGFCLKSSGPRTLFEAIEQVTRSLPYCDPKITQLVKQSPTTSTHRRQNGGQRRRLASHIHSRLTCRGDIHTVYTTACLIKVCKVHFPQRAVHLTSSVRSKWPKPVYTRTIFKARRLLACIPSAHGST